MKGKQKYNRRKLAIYIIAVTAMIAALSLCFYMIHNINQRMNDSATSNLLNSTSVIEDTIENYIEKDFESLKVAGEFYSNREYLESGKIDVLCDTMGFEWMGAVDTQGNGVDCFEDKFQAENVPGYDEWKPGESGYSDAYIGDSGHLEVTLWVPMYREHELLGTMFGGIIISKYYSANVFTFYEGDGRTYLFDGSDGSWILKSMGTDGATKRQDDIYSLLLSSGNDEQKVDQFKQAVEKKRTGTAVFSYNGEQSYICFMPLSSSEDWYVATVIAKADLLKESVQVQRMIQLILGVFCVFFLFLTVFFATWQIRKAKVKEANYREALFRNVSSNIDSAFLIYEKGTRSTVFVSDNVKRLLGMERKQLAKDAVYLFEWCGICKNDPQRLAFLNGTLDAPIVREVCVPNELGIHSRYIRLELIPADLGQEIAVLTDITADKDIQKSLVEAFERAEAASKAKNEFLSAMSHDIRTPMNGILGMTAIAATHLDDRNRVHDCLTKISEASDHLLSLINEVLDMSQIESGRLELSNEPFILAEPLQEILKLSYSECRQKNLTVKTYIHSVEHEQVIGDSVRLKRIVENLISNAIKYTPAGGKITLSLCEKTSVLSGYGCYELTIQDNGIGMSSEFQKKLFQPFEREEDVRISKIPGTGLGMSIVKNLVDLMMGDIEVESEKGKGTTFTFTVNLRLDEQDLVVKERLKSLSVLVVDDDPVTCQASMEMLTDIGISAQCANNSIEAVERITKRDQNKDDYIAILMEYEMSAGDGIEVTRQIRAELQEEMPAVILSAYDWSEIEEKARDAGAEAFLQKPVYKTRLSLVLQQLTEREIEKHKLADEIISNVIPPDKNVLLVEDNELNIEIAAELLGMLGVHVHVAQDGLQAESCFSKSEPGYYDLILMDIQMPKENGYDATRNIRNMDRTDARTIPIVAMTADAYVKDVQAAHAAGMDAHLAKPISVERLEQMLVRFLAGSDKESMMEDKARDEKRN